MLGHLVSHVTWYVRLFSLLGYVVCVRSLGVLGYALC